MSGPWHGPGDATLVTVDERQAAVALEDLLFPLGSLQQSAQPRPDRLRLRLAHDALAIRGSRGRREPGPPPEEEPAATRLEWRCWRQTAGEVLTQSMGCPSRLQASVEPGLRAKWRRLDDDYRIEVLGLPSAPPGGRVVDLCPAEVRAAGLDDGERHDDQPVGICMRPRHGRGHRVGLVPLAAALQEVAPANAESACRGVDVCGDAAQVDCARGADEGYAAEPDGLIAEVAQVRQAHVDDVNRVCCHALAESGADGEDYVFAG